MQKTVAAVDLGKRFRAVFNEVTKDHVPYLVTREQSLRQEAERQVLPADAKDPGEELSKLLQSWIEEGDAQEQQETAELLIRTLDEDRLSDRRLFPAELKGVIW